MKSLTTQLMEALKKAKIPYRLEMGDVEQHDEADMVDPCISLRNNKYHHIQVLEPHTYGTSGQGFQVNELIYDADEIVGIVSPQKGLFKKDEINRLVEFIKTL